MFSYNSPLDAFHHFINISLGSLIHAHKYGKAVNKELFTCLDVDLLDQLKERRVSILTWSRPLEVLAETGPTLNTLWS